MAVVPTIALELNLDSDQWTDVSSDTLTDEGIRFRYGILSFHPAQRVASPGSLEFALDNQHTKGLYTPGHASARAGFNVGAGARLAFTYGGQTYYKWRGRIVSIEPDVGLFGDGRSVVKAQDWIADAARIRPRQVPLRTSQRADQLLSALVSELTIKPPDTDFSTGKSTFTYGFDDARDGQTTAYELMRSISESEFGWIYQVGDTDTGGVLTFDDRHRRILTTDVLVTLDDDSDTDDLMGLSVANNEEALFNLITAFAFPRTVDTSPNKILWRHTGDPIYITAGETKTFIGEYTDSDNPDSRIGGADVVTPVQGTDYIFSGPDSDLTVVATLGSNSAKLEVTLAAAATAGTINTLQVRGKRVLIYQPTLVEATDSDSRNSFGDRTLEMRFRYQEDALQAQDFIDVTLSRFKDPKIRPSDVTFVPNKSDGLMLAFLQGEPGSRVTLAEQVSAVSGDFFINGVQAEIERGRLIEATWYVDEAPTEAYWILNTSGLDTDAVLGF